MKNLSKKYPFMLSALLVLLILLHGLYARYFLVDNATILLVTMLVLLPYIPLLNRIKFGSFEAEIGHEDVKRVEKKISQITSARSFGSRKPSSLELLAEGDPNLALVKARIEIEKRVRSLAEIYLGPEWEDGSVWLLVRELKQQAIIEAPLDALIGDVVGVANQALHGASIKLSDAIKLAGYASRVIEQLDSVILDKALQADTRTITSEAAQQYAGKQYILKTIIPGEKTSELKTYRLNQSELDAFLEGYDEYGEYIVSLENMKIRKAPSHGTKPSISSRK